MHRALLGSGLLDEKEKKEKKKETNNIDFPREEESRNE